MGFGARLSERFRIVSRLGEGAYGTVYEAIDTERSERVAVKVLHRVGPEEIFRFKREFRSLQDTRHPNLVRLGELIESQGRFMFTMELVHGSDLLSYVRSLDSAPPNELGVSQGSGRRLDERRLRQSLGQLALGLSALHAAGKVHRDIKPPNVRVDTDGRVVLLDFGLMLDAADESGSTAAGLVGTAGYMSPEQAGSQPITAASDWYSVGVLMYEALTGRRPFTGPALQVLFDKQQQAPAPPSVHVPHVPEDLEALCMALLRADPAARPTGPQVVRALGASFAEGALETYQGFFGRDVELRRLQEAVDALIAGRRRAHAYVAGDAGVGKSRLLAEWLLRVRRHQPSVLVLRSRAHEAESVSFRAFDGSVDALSRALRQMPAQRLVEVLPEANYASLLHVFPVLGRVEPLARRAAGQPAGGDPWATRDEAFDALRAILAALARTRPIVIVLDDLHLSDGESLQLLERLMAQPSPALLVVAAGSQLDRCGPAVQRFVTSSLGISVRQVTELRGMDLDSGRQYAEVLLRHGAHGWPEPHAAGLAEHIARGAHGHPLFIRFLVRHGRPAADGAAIPQLREELGRHVRQLPAPERQALTLLAVSGCPLGEGLLRSATRMPGGELSGLLSSLVRSALAAEEAAGDKRAHGVSQDLVRDAVLEVCSEAELREAHAALSRAYLEVEPGETESLAIHLSASGQIEKALHFAIVAAGAAYDSRAFERAARLFRLALDLAPATGDPEGRRRLWRRNAEALAAAGRSRQAADAFLEAARGMSGLMLARMRMRAAQHMMQAGDVVEASSLIRDLLSQAGLPGGGAGGRFRLRYERTRLWLRGLDHERRSETWSKASELFELDLFWAAYGMLSRVDPVAGRGLQARYLARALDVGEPKRLARAFAVEAQLEQLRHPRPQPRVTQLFAQARILAEASGDARAHASVSLAEGAAAAGLGRFAQALAKLDDARGTLRRHVSGDPWEHDAVHQQRVWVLLSMGRFAELLRSTPRLIASAHDRGDRHAEAALSLSAGYWVPLLSGDTEGARERLEWGRRLWEEAQYACEYMPVFAGAVQLALWSEPRRARPVFRATVQRCPMERGARIPCFDLQTTFLAAQCELAASLFEPRSVEKRSLRRARALAQRLWQSPLSHAPAHGALVAATVSARRGDEVQAVSLLNEAAVGFQAHGMSLHAAACRYREGQLIGGERGRAQVASSVAWSVAQGIDEADALLRCASPGFFER